MITGDENATALRKGRRPFFSHMAADDNLDKIKRV